MSISTLAEIFLCLIAYDLSLNRLCFSIIRDIIFYEEFLHKCIKLYKHIHRFKTMVIQRLFELRVYKAREAIYSLFFFFARRNIMFISNSTDARHADVVSHNHRRPSSIHLSEIFYELLSFHETRDTIDDQFQHSSNRYQENPRRCSIFETIYLRRKIIRMSPESREKSNRLRSPSSKSMKRFKDLYKTTYISNKQSWRK